MSYKGRYQFDRQKILQDFKNLTEFREAFGVTKLTFFRGITCLNRHRVPKRYLTDTLWSEVRIFAPDGILVTSIKEEATHILEIQDGKPILKESK